MFSFKHSRLCESRFRSISSQLKQTITTTTMERCNKGRTTMRQVFCYYFPWLLLQLPVSVRPFGVQGPIQHLQLHEVSQRKFHSVHQAATVQRDHDATPSSSASPPPPAPLSQKVLDCMSSIRHDANQYAESFGLTCAEAAFYALFRAIRNVPVPLNLYGEPFMLRHNDVETAFGQPTGWIGFFTMSDLEKAVSDDFLDAARGSTDNRKGWKVRASSPSSSSPQRRPARRDCA